METRLRVGLMGLLMMGGLWPLQGWSNPLQQEINHLFEYLTQSDCHFIRNGKVYSGKDAVPHIRKKYEHYRDEIKSGEDFIRLSASKSLISKKPYWVQCGDGTRVLSQQWLTQELERFRQQK